MDKGLCTPKHDPSMHTWLTKFEMEELECPAQSPDLKPAEHIWIDLKHRLNPRTLQIPTITLQNLVEFIITAKEDSACCGMLKKHTLSFMVRCLQIFGHTVLSSLVYHKVLENVLF